MEYLLGGVLFALFIAAQALALVAIRPVSMQKSLQLRIEAERSSHRHAFSPFDRRRADSQLSARARRLLL